MAKNQLAIVRFDGGFQNALDSRDLPPEAWSEVMNASINKVGIVSLLNPAIVHEQEFVYPGSTMIFPFGYGLFHWGSDYAIGRTLTGDFTFSDSTETGFNGDLSLAQIDYVNIRYTDGATAHGLSIGDYITIDGTGGDYNGNHLTFTQGTATYYDTNTNFPFFRVVYVNDNGFDFTINAFFDQNGPYQDGSVTITTGVSDGELGQFSNLSFQSDDKINIWQTNRDSGVSTLLSSAVDIGVADNPIIPSYYRAKGGLRVCDSNFNNTNAANIGRWFGYIPVRKYADGDAGGTTVNHTTTAGWFDLPAGLESPESNAEGIETNTALNGNRNGIILDAHDSGIDADNAGTFEALVAAETEARCDGIVWSIAKNDYIEGEYNGAIDGDEHRSLAFGCSWIYDGHQESKVAPITWFAPVSSTDNFRPFSKFGFTKSNRSLIIEAYLKVNHDATTLNLNQRKTGCRLYIIGQAGTEPLATTGALTNGHYYDDPLFLAELDFQKGLKLHDGDFAGFDGTGYGGGWAEAEFDPAGGSDNFWAKSRQLISSQFPNVSFRMLTGYEHSVSSITARYKTACVVNNKTYIGNVEQDVTGDGVVEVFDDRILVSSVGNLGPMPDVFPSDRILEITSNDGDHIVKLEAFKEKIVQLNRNKAIIINVYGPNDLETVESTWLHAGISDPCSSTTFQAGVVWASKTGCYFYDGEKVINLIDGKIAEYTWEDFIVNGGTPVVAFCPTDKTINVVCSTGNSYHFSILTQGWMRGTGLLSSGDGHSGVIMSNMSTDPITGEIIFLSNNNPGTASGSETFTQNIVQDAVQGAPSSGSIIFNDVIGGSLSSPDEAYLTAYIADEGFQQIGTPTLTWDCSITGGQLGTVDTVGNEEVANIIADSINQYDGTWKFQAEVIVSDTRGFGHGGGHGVRDTSTTSKSRVPHWSSRDTNFKGGGHGSSEPVTEDQTREGFEPLVEIVITSRSYGAVYNSGSDTDTELSEMNQPSGFRIEGPEGDIMGGIRHMVYIYGVFWQPQFNNPPLAGGIENQDSIVVCEVDRAGETTQGDVYSLSFNLLQDSEQVQAYTHTYTLGSAVTEETIVNYFLADINTNAGQYVTASRATDSSGTDAGSGGDYDFLKIESITGDDTSGTATQISGLVTGVTDNLESWAVMKWKPTIQRKDMHSFEMTTKDLDFGAPGVRKKIHKIYITYKGGGDDSFNNGEFSQNSGIAALYAVNQGEFNGVFSVTKSKNYTDHMTDLGSLTLYSGAVTVAELKPELSINNIYSFQLKLFSEGMVPRDFEINDLTIIYRAKPVK